MSATAFRSIRFWDKNTGEEIGVMAAMLTIHEGETQDSLGKTLDAIVDEIEKQSPPDGWIISVDWTDDLWDKS